MISKDDLEARTDLLSRFMQLKGPDGKPYTDAYLRSIVINFILAGRDTTASCLSWLMYCLAKNPAAEARLREEIAEQGDSDFGFETVREANMPYLHATITETLRLYVLWCSARPPCPPTCRPRPLRVYTCLFLPPWLVLSSTSCAPLARYPSVPSDFKTAVEDDTLPSGHVIEAGWQVDYSQCEPNPFPRAGAAAAAAAAAS